MSCRIVRDYKGKIEKVFNAQGLESKLYTDIASNPSVKTQDEALEIYKKIKETEYEPTVQYKNVVGESFGSFKTALSKSLGQDVVMGATIDGDFHPILTVPFNNDPTTESGFVTHGILTNLINERMELIDGEYMLVPAGAQESTQAINKELLKIEAQTFLGRAGVEQRYDKYFKFSNPNHTTKAVNKRGVVEEISKTDLEGKTLKELEQKYDNAFDLLMQEELRKSSMLRDSNDFMESDTTLSEQDLRVRLLNFLEKIGVKTATIEGYVKRYKLKNGVDPSAEALADISNKVIAFKDGKIGTDALSEEVAHFIVEGWNQEEIENLLRNVENTPEWAKYSEKYRAIYSKEYSAEELEEAVQREVLGKILAASFKNNFNTQETGEESNIVINFIKRMFEKTIAMFKSFWKPTYQKDIDKFTDQVNQLLQQKNLESKINTDNFTDNRFRLYSSDLSEIRVLLNKGIDNIQKNLYDLSKEDKTLAFDLTKSNLHKAGIDLKKAEGNVSAQLTELDEQMKKEAVLSIAEAAQKQIKYLEQAIKENNKGDRKYLFNNEQNNVYHSLQGQLRPILQEMKFVLKDKFEKDRQWDAAKNGVTETLAALDDLVGVVGDNDVKAVDRLIDQVMVRHNLSPEYRETVEKWMETAERDTFFMHYQFGQLIHAKNPLLNLFGAVIHNMNTSAYNGFLESIKPFNQKIIDLGFSQKDLKKLIGEGNYLRSDINFEQFEQDKKAEYLKAYKTATRTKLSDKELSKLYDKDDLPKVKSFTQTTINNLFRTAMNDNLEKVFLPSYYNERDARYKALSISPSTIAYLNGLSISRSELTRKATVNGKVDFRRLNEYEAGQLKDIAKERARKKDIFGEDGKLKAGVKKLSRDEAYDIIEANIAQGYLKEGTKNAVLAKYKGRTQLKLGDNIYDIDVFIPEAQLAIEIQRLDFDYIEQAEKEGIAKLEGVPQEFLDALKEAEQESKFGGLEFLFANSRVDLSDSYWEQLTSGDTVTLKERLIKVKNANSDLQQPINQLIEQMEDNKDSIRSILKQHKNQNKPVEVEADGMSKLAFDSVKEYQTNLQDIYRKINRILKAQESEETNKKHREQQRLSEVDVNEAYEKAIADLNQDNIVEEEFNYILEHVTQGDKAELIEFKTIMNQLENDEITSVPDRIDFIMERYDGDFDSILLQYSRSKLLPYYKRVVPQGYNNLMDNLNRGEGFAGSMSATELVNGVISGEIDYLKVTPHYTFFEKEAHELLNPNYDHNFEGGFSQPNKKKYRDDEFFSRYKPTKDADGKWQATTNTKEFAARELLLGLQRESLAAMGELGRHNLYALPQVSKNTYEKAEKLFQGVTVDKLNEIFRDIVSYRIDDLEYGETIDGVIGAGVDREVIPKFFIKPLESQTDVSTELLFSYSMMSQQAQLYKARRDNVGDAHAIKDALAGSTMKGKQVENSNTMAMFKSYMDFNFFGKKETAKFKITVMGKEIDLTKMVRLLHRFVQFRNLGLNVIIPATSALTAEISQQTEQLIGEYTHPDSAWLASKEFKKLAPAAMAEMGKLQSNAELNIMGEYMGVYEYENRFENSDYSYVMRNLKKTGMMMHSMANFPIIPRVMLSVLYDYRVIDGQIMNFNQYKSKYKNVPKTDLKAKWKEAEKDSMYNYRKVTKTNMSFDVERLREKLGDTVITNGIETSIEDYVQEKYLGIKSRAAFVVQAVDGSMTQEQKSNAHRHFLLSFLLTHRNWLGIALQRRTKGKHTSLATGEQEMGHYIAPFVFMNDMWDEIRKEGVGSTVKIMQDMYKNADPSMRNAIQRIGIEFVVLNLVGLLGYAIVGMGDDDDDSILAQNISYLAMRTMNEVASQSFAIHKEVFQSIQSPVVGLNVIESMIQSKDILSGEIVEAGRYRGLTKGARRRLKLIPGLKSYYDVMDAKSARDTYYFYNQSNIRTAITADILFGMDEKSK